MYQKKMNAFFTPLNILIILFYGFPLFVMLTTSFKTNTQILGEPQKMIPNPAIITNYQKIFSSYPIGNWFKNSLIVCVGTVIVVLLVSLPAAYAFARLHFRFKKVLFMLTLVTVMMPLFAYMPQLYLLMYYMKLLNTYWSLILPMAITGTNIFMIRQFLIQIPTELDDAARLDGCSEFQVFFRILLPLLRPVIITVVLFTAIRSWNSLMWPLIATTGEKLKTLPIGLAVNVFTAGGITGSVRSGAYGEMMAAATVAIFFPVLLFLFLQKYFVQGIASTGMK